MLRLSFFEECIYYNDTACLGSDYRCGHMRWKGKPVTGKQEAKNLSAWDIG
jgi:hypothetical protein